MDIEHIGLLSGKWEALEVGLNTLQEQIGFARTLGLLDKDAFTVVVKYQNTVEFNLPVSRTEFMAYVERASSDMRRQQIDLAEKIKSLAAG